MANVIVSDITTSEQCAQIRRGAIVRDPGPLVFTPSWNKVRVAIFYKMSLEAAVSMGGTPRLNIGMCAGSSLVPGELGTVACAAGLTTNTTTWNTTAVGWSAAATVAAVPVTYSNGVATLGASGLANPVNFHHGAFAMRFVDVTRTAAYPGNWAFSHFTFNPSASSTVPTDTLADFNSLSLVATPAKTNYLYISPGNVAAPDEATYGSIDHVYVSWDQYINPVNIRAIRVVKFS